MDLGVGQMDCSCPGSMNLGIGQMDCSCPCLACVDLEIGQMDCSCPGCMDLGIGQMVQLVFKCQIKQVPISQFILSLL